MLAPVAHLVAGRRSKYAVLVFWLLLVAAAAPLAGKLSGAEQNDAKSWLPGSAESTQVLDAQSAFQSPDTLHGVVVYERRSGLTADDRTKVAGDARRLAALPGVNGPLVGPVFSPDGQAAEVVVSLDLGKEGWQKAQQVADRVRAIGAGDPGLAVHVTGPLGNAADSSAAFEGIDSTLLFAALGVVIVLLLLTYRSPVLWLLPVISAGVALMSAEAAIYLLARHAGLVVNAQSAGILTVLVFGAGTDYALLLVARYREELRRHSDRHQAMAVALHRAGPAIVASAGTVVAGLLVLLVAETNSTSGLGPVAAVGVAVGLCAMITLLPALLVTTGRWVFWPTRPRYGTAEPTASGRWARVGTWIARRPRGVWVLTTVALGVMAVGLTGLNAHGLTNKESFRSSVDSVAGEEAAARHFPAGAGSPVVVLARADAAARVGPTVAATRGIASVTPPVVKGDLAYLQATLSSAPDSPAAYATVDRVRSAVHALPGADALVGGNTAVNLDVQRAAAHDRNLVIPLVLVVVLGILVLLLRAVVAPLLLVATVVLSFAASLGVSAWVFRHLFGFAGTDASLPLFIFVFLVALGIDYNIFLMTRVREETLQRGTRAGAVTGLAATGGVITSAGFVLAGTFAVLGTLPLTAFAEIGFAVAFGVLLDTIVVRSVFVTALTLDVGRWVWWPSRLARSDAAQADTLDAPAQAHVQLG